MARTPRVARASRGSPRPQRRAALAFDALLVEGALIAQAQLARVAALDAGDQTPADYAVPRGLVLRDEIPRFYRIGQALFDDLNAAPHPSEAATVAFTHALLRDVFGFNDLAPQPGVTLAALGGRVPVIVVPPSDGLDRPSASLSAAAGHHTSAALALQDWLNAQDNILWGLACNGERLRLLRDNPSLTRPAYIEADLRRIFEADALADFTALWLLMHASRFGAPDTPPTDCIVERWREAGQKAGEAARERLRDGVERALAEIGDGLLRHPANGALRERLASGALPLPYFFGQLLHLVYRMIFLLAAEDRGLLHPPTAIAAARTLYVTGYSLSRLRDRAVRPAAWDAHDDLWDGLCILFAALARGEARLGLPALDGLFAPGASPDLDDAALSNKALLRAVRGLAWLEGAGAPIPVNWRDMETEELGSVYESLLELTPILTANGHGFAFTKGAETRGNQRKITGSYYTPDSLVQALLASALDPVLERVHAEADDPAEALLGVKVLDPACGSGHFLLAAGRHIAARLARLRAGGTAGAEEYRHALRDVSRACLHGVDRNPMAVELAKVALWIETVEPGKPLGFLDANLRCGDSLLGVFDLDALRLGIPDAAYKPLTGDDRVVCRALEARNAAERGGQGALDYRAGGGRLPPTAPLARAAQIWRALPEDSPEQIAAKRVRFAAARAAPDAYALQVACDLYVAAFLSPKPAGLDVAAASSLVPTTAAVWQRATGGQIYPPLEGRAVDLARGAGAFHWPLEFPEVMAAGGFDVVLGNPPWEVSQLDTKEFLARHATALATLEGRDRKAALAKLELGNPFVWNELQKAIRGQELQALFARGSGRFPLTSNGKLNLYSLFAEFAVSLINARGRLGMVLQSGIATDHVNGSFFSRLISSGRLHSVFDMVNREGIFPGVHRSHPHFCLFTTAGTDIGKPAIASFHSTNTTHIRDPRRTFLLEQSDLLLFNPNTGTCPIFMSERDAKLARRLYRAQPILILERSTHSANLWSIDLIQNFFSHTNDGKLFLLKEELGPFDQDGIRCLTTDASYLPLFEGKMVDRYDHRYGSFSERGSDRGNRVLPSTSPVAYANPAYDAESHFWVRESLVKARANEKGLANDWLMVWKDITTSITERTVKAAIIPFSATDDTLSILSTAEKHKVRAPLLVANLNCIVLDYVARQKVSGLHLRRNVMAQLPILPPDAYSTEDAAYILSRVIELTYTSNSLAPFARAFGYGGAAFPWEEERRSVISAELDAWYARAYQLNREDLRYILDPADICGPEYPSETFRVLKENEIRRYGEYRTRRLVLEAWDRLGYGA